MLKTSCKWLASAAAVAVAGLTLVAQTPAGSPGQGAPGAGAQTPGPGGAGQPGGRGAGGGGRGGVGNELADFSPKPPVLPKTPADEAKTFIVPPGYHMELVASDPDLVQPAFVEFDGNGRMYVGELRTYMLDASGTGEYEPGSRISRWESTHGDGVYDKHTVFADNLVLPRMVLTLDKDSILINETHSDYVYKLTDTNGDGVADKKEVFYTGVGLNRDGNIEHEQSGFVWNLDNWIYSTFNAFRFRITPRGILKEPVGSSGGQWGMSHDDDGKTWNIDAGAEQGPVSFQIPIEYGSMNHPDGMEPGFQIPYPAPGISDPQGGMNRVRLPNGTLNHFTAAAGPDIFRGDALPADLEGDLLFTEPVGRIVRRTKIVKTEGLTQLRNAYPGSEFVLGTDPLFRPVNLRTAPDGTLFIVDMYHGIVQDVAFEGPGSYLRQKVYQYQLDKVVGYGRIWRLRYDGIPPTPASPSSPGSPDEPGVKGIPPNRTQPRMFDETAAQLVTHLTNPNGWWRDNAQRLLVLRQDKTVVPALVQMVRTSDSLVGRFHALWTLEGLDAMDAALVREEMKDANPRMRVQAIRASETLYKAGDRTFADDYRAMTKDADPDVAIQAMLTVNTLKIGDVAATVKDAQAASKAKGVQDVGTWILNPAAFGAGRGVDRAGGAPLTADQQNLMQQGGQTFESICFTCHGADGRGQPQAGAAPGMTMGAPLAGSPRVLGHRDYVIKVLLNGLTGPVDGKTYTEVMIPMGTNPDAWVAAVASYVRNSFGNTAGFITPADVARVRAATTGRKTQWTVADLEASLPVLLPSDPGWKFSASHNPAAVANALNLTGWSTATPQAAGMWFQVELPAAVNLTEIQFNSAGAGRGGGGGRGAAGPGRAGAAPGRGGPGTPPGPGAPPGAPAGQPAPAQPGTPAAGAAGAGAGGRGGPGAPGAPAPTATGYPREYTVQVSMDGTKWSTPIAQGKGDGALTAIAFKPVQAKFVRITETATDATSPAWSIMNLRLFTAPTPRAPAR